MPNIPALHHIDHIFTDVLGVIADPLQRPGHPGDIHDALDAARILHHERDALALYSFVFLVHTFVFFLLADR